MEIDALKFWNAAKFLRRAPERDPKIAHAVLHNLIKTAALPIARRAVETLKGSLNERNR